MGPEKTALQGGGTPLNVCVPPPKYEGLFTITYTTIYSMPHSMSYAQINADFGGGGGTSLEYVVCYGTKKRWTREKQACLGVLLHRDSIGNRKKKKEKTTRMRNVLEQHRSMTQFFNSGLCEL